MICTARPESSMTISPEAAISSRSCMYQAHIMGTASFMISEGWKRMKPTSSQRCAPLPMWPVTSTTISRATPMA